MRHQSPARVALVPDLLTRAALIGSATLHEAAGRTGDLPHQVKPVHPHFRVCGPAFPVSCPTGNNLQIHHALLATRPGDVLVVDVGTGDEFGYWGEVLSEAASARSLGGVVLSGCARDQAEMGVVGFPVFSSGICIRGTGKSTTGGSVGRAIRVGGVDIHAGDLIVGDIDGVVCIPRSAIADVVRAAEARLSKEADIIERLRAGASTVELYDFPGLVP